ncbi:hypothetical protein CXG81DRAFT_24738 [Caulochytrium protostelioides]|uniref:Ribosomal protein S3 n=1 Tax=Caulochytrium protostelioides TaxID=1555241 RepID=A0A4P9XB52_9FUNG|nr:hypothetical protein CXG81DRAFT_24738 [Caulochytrium protostelioides]|eukprot:RKP02596.1 hypothetical protein CXG81DRAFT_24738 [Caulochytrium protostelioides]
MSGQANFLKLTREFARMSVRAPQGKYPVGYNTHLLRAHPFDATAVPASSVLKADPSAFQKHAVVAQQSRKFDRLNRAPRRNPDILPADWTPAAEEVSDLPLPLAIRRQVIAPSPSLATPHYRGKITGIRLEVNGKRGTRASKQIFHVGALNINDRMNSAVEFAKDTFILRAGISGVRIWLGYAK